MASLKRLAIVSASLGAGAVVMSAVLVALFTWYSSRPNPPKPWDAKAITATFDYPETEKVALNAPTIVLYYTLQNKTDLDYRLPKRDLLEVTARLKREKSLTGGPELLTEDESVFIPAKQRRRFAIHLKYPIEDDLGPDPKSKDDHRRRWKLIADFMKTNLSNLDGFVIFDPERRYQIDLPNGWDNIDLQ